MQENFLRAKAETENVRRRAQEDVEKAHKFAIERFAEHLLPVIDSLEAAATDSSGDLDKVREGIELTLRQLNSALEKGRVVVINPIGEKFDPHRHQAISMVPAEQEANTVVTVLQKGFLIGGPRPASRTRDGFGGEVSAGAAAVRAKSNAKKRWPCSRQGLEMK